MPNPSSVEFWGAEVKPNESLKVQFDARKVLRMSLAALGEPKKKRRRFPASVSLYVKVDDKKFAVGTLLVVGRPQMALDLVLDKKFELSHSWTKGSVYFCGNTVHDHLGKAKDAADGTDEYKELENDIYSLSESDHSSDYEDVSTPGVSNMVNMGIL